MVGDHCDTFLLVVLSAWSLLVTRNMLRVLGGRLICHYALARRLFPVHLNLIAYHGFVPI